MLKHDNLEISVTQENFEIGQKIEVVSGPLIGLQGKLVKIKGKNKVAVILEKLGYSAVIEISTENLRISETNQITSA